MWETQVQTLGWKDPLEKGLATHSNIFAWRIVWTEEPAGLQSMGPQRAGQDLATNTTSLITPGQSHSEYSGKEDTALDLSAQWGRLIRKKIMGKSFHQCSGGMM